MDIALLDGIGRQPLTDVLPAGSDVRDDPRFDALQLEIGKLSNPGSDGQTDWPRVGQLCALLLAEKGKDLLVAGYLNAALIQGDGLAGLATGLEVVGDMIEHFWDGMFPPLARLRARRNAMQWLLDRAAQSAEEQHWSELDPQPAVLMARLVAATKRIDELLRAKDEDAPSMRSLQILIDRVPVQEEASVAPAAAPAASKPAAATPSSASASRAASTALSATLPAPTGDVDTSLAAAFDHLNQLVDTMMSADLHDARAYRIVRFANWGGVDALPPADNGRTMIAPPIAQVAEALQRMQDAALEAAGAEDAILFAEAQLPAFPFWLDLQSLCAGGLARMGEAGAAARGEVERATRDLLQRLPGLDALSFANGMPFANGPTLEWIESLSVAGGAAGGEARPAKTNGLGATLAQARSLAAGGDLDAAVALMQQAIAQAPDAPGRLRAQIRLCELLSAHREGRVPVAFAQLIVEQIRHHDLDRWEPALAVEGWVAAHGVLNQDEAHLDERDAARSAIARLDAVRAIAL